jgi:hypothetical protein
MKNLNKFTKAELINKYTKLENLNHQNSNQTQSKYHSILKIIDKILLFKSLILKITLITLIIRWIKKYSLVKKFWHIFSLLGNTLLGFTLIDIYAFDIISWIKDSSIYIWYSDLFSNSKTDKIETIEKPSKFPKGMIERTSIETNGNENGNQKSDEISNKINRWFNKEEITNKEPKVLSKEEFNSLEESNKFNYKNYIILGSIIIISGIIYYYWNDIRPAAGDAGNTIIEKIRSFRSWFNNDSNNIIDNNPGNNSMNIQTNINQDIQLVDNTPSSNIQSIESSNVRSVLTSPSLENLNEQAESSWNEELSSPDSDKTVTPASISESSASSSSSINTISTVSSFIKDNWRKRFTEETNDKINFIESTLNSEIDLDIDLKLADYFAYIINEYNKEIEVYNKFKSDSNPNIQDLNIMRQSMYYFRKWIAEYQSKIFTSSNVTIEIGNIQDSPKILSKNIV